MGNHPSTGSTSTGRVTQPPIFDLDYIMRTFVYGPSSHTVNNEVGSSEGPLSSQPEGGDTADDDKPENSPREDRPVETPEEIRPDKPLKVKLIDLKVDENTQQHNTDLYDITQAESEEDQKKRQLVVRRGDKFKVEVFMDRKLEEKFDQLTIVFDIGDTPKVSKNTLLFLDTSKGIKPREWGAHIEEVKGTAVNIMIQAAPEAIIGKWNISIHTSFKGKTTGEKKVVNTHKHPKPVYMLFNPWCKEDQVYMEDENLRDEYVMNDTGKIYSGNYKQISFKPWNFGQFEEDILDIAMYLLDRSGLKYSARQDPIMISRKIAAHVNSNDDNGVLVGNWSGNYEGGISPTAWGGSVAILQQFHDTKRPVEYGQCWVFSGVVTTVSRALGLPCRSVTNFASAHDTDGSITIDVHWDTNNEPVNHLNNDSVWNFHVWNEAWMSRPDLPPGHGGWQAFDATPQELSDNVYCAGPTSVTAIKEGNTFLKYDTHFVFAEVNADKVHWIHQEDGSDKHALDKHTIGKKISTKWPRNVRREPPSRSFFDMYHRVKDDPDRYDITDEYKYKEGSEEERAAVLRANLRSTKPEVYKHKQDVTFELHEKDFIFVGSGFDVTLKVQNNSREVRSIKGSITVYTTYYTGVSRDKVKKHDFEVELKAIKSDEVVCRIGMEEYLHLIVDQVSFGIFAKAEVLETDQQYAETDTFRLRRPDLELSAPEKVQRGEPFEVEIKLNSPMPESLTQCKWIVEGPGLKKPETIKQKDLDPYDRVTIRVPFTAKNKLGKREIIANFDSKELKDVTGSCIVTVVE